MSDDNDMLVAMCRMGSVHVHTVPAGASVRRFRSGLLVAGSSFKPYIVRFDGSVEQIEMEEGTPVLRFLGNAEERKTAK